MKIVKSLILPIVLSSGALAMAWQGYGAWLAAQIGKVEIREVSALTVQNEHTLPFFELMSPIPSVERTQMLPKLEYKKGPPERFIERISMVIQGPVEGKKERIVFFGRRTRTDLLGINFFPEETAREAHYMEAALRLSQGQPIANLGAFETFLLKPLLLREATHLLEGVETAYLMDQAGTPAFLFASHPGENGRAKASALFIRRNSFYRVDYSADRGFEVLDPLTTFRKSFLTEKRADALEYLARNLSEVHMEKQELKSLQFRDIAWPILLLAANVSVDPSSIEAYFHFAGISALLYRSETGGVKDTETFDILRNNVLASEFYAKDVNPSAPKTAEISRLARMLTRNFD